MYPAFLNSGPVELLLIGILFFVLFGADKVPELARQLGRAQAEFNKARKTFMAEFKSEDEKRLDKQYAFEAQRERQMQAQKYGELENLRAAASALGIPTDGKDANQLRQDIAAITTAGQSGAVGGSGGPEPPSP